MHGLREQEDPTYHTQQEGSPFQVPHPTPPGFSGSLFSAILFSR